MLTIKQVASRNTVYVEFDLHSKICHNWFESSTCLSPFYWWVSRHIKTPTKRSYLLRILKSSFGHDGPPFVLY